jgi:phage tail-like protein
MSWWTVPPVPVAEDSNRIYILEPVATEVNRIYIYPPLEDFGRIAIIAENEAARDQGEIMIQKITQTFFRDNLKLYIPNEYWRWDAKLTEEGGGEGALEDFTEVFAITLDEIKQAIDEFPQLFDIDHCPTEYLQVIATLLNFPLEDTDTTAEQRRQLKDAVNWYKVKGSRRAFISMLYAFGFHAEVIPLWTEYADVSDIPDENGDPQTNLYQLFFETIPGVARGNDPPNDYPLLIENGGQWFRSPHFGIRLVGIINDRHVTINWGGLTEGELPIEDEIISEEPDGSTTAFAGIIKHFPIIPGTFTGTAQLGWLPTDPATTITDNGSGVLSGANTSGTIDYDTGYWTLTFTVAPINRSKIIFDYTYDFDSLVEEIGYHAAFYRMIDELSKQDVLLQYHFDTDKFNYVWRRLEFLRPVFAVLDWLAFLVEMQEHYDVPESENPVMTVMPTRDEKGWYLGYCDMDDAIYTRMDERLLGPNLYTITSPLGAGSGATDVVDEVIYTVPGPSETEASGTLNFYWIYPSIEITVTIGASPYTVLDNQEGVLVGEDETVYGTIDYLTGDWQLFFDGVNPDNATNILADYSYTTTVPPCDRSGVYPRGSTALPYPHLRDPQEGYCHPPEELWIDWYWIQPEQYELPLTRDGMNLYPPAGPVPYIDHADFPSRGFYDGSGPGHANTLTREYGYSLLPLSLLRVEANPADESEQWENQTGTAWESWTGTNWENIGT